MIYQSCLTDGCPQDGHGEEKGGGEHHCQVDQQRAHHVVHSVHLYTTTLYTNIHKHTFVLFLTIYEWVVDAMMFAIIEMVFMDFGSDVFYK